MNQLIIAFGCGLAVGIIITGFMICFGVGEQMKRWKE